MTHIKCLAEILNISLQATRMVQYAYAVNGEAACAPLH